MRWSTISTTPSAAGATCQATCRTPPRRWTSRCTTRWRAAPAARCGTCCRTRRAPSCRPTSRAPAHPTGPAGSRASGAGPRRARQRSSCSCAASPRQTSRSSTRCGRPCPRSRGGRWMRCGPARAGTGRHRRVVPTASVAPAGSSARCCPRTCPGTWRCRPPPAARSRLASTSAPRCRPSPGWMHGPCRSCSPTSAEPASCRPGACSPRRGTWASA